MPRSAAVIIVAVLFGSSVQAAEHEVRMVTVQSGEMLFDPDFVQAEPGDTIRFIPVDPTHNAETIRGMIPEGAEPFKGGISEEFTATLTEEGIYGIMCKSHYATGMVMTVVVGDPANLDRVTRRPHPSKARVSVMVKRDLASRGDQP